MSLSSGYGTLDVHPESDIANQGGDLVRVESILRVRDKETSVGIRVCG